MMKQLGRFAKKGHIGDYEAYGDLFRFCWNDNLMLSTVQYVTCVSINVLKAKT